MFVNGFNQQLINTGEANIIQTIVVQETKLFNFMLVIHTCILFVYYFRFCYFILGTWFPRRVRKPAWVRHSK